MESDLTNMQMLGQHARHCRLCCTTAVCEDIWKKFAFEEVEVFPTPPVSPRLSPEPTSDSDEEQCCLEQITNSLFQEFEDEDERDDDKQQLEEFETYQNLLKSKLIQVRPAILFMQWEHMGLL